MISVHTPTCYDVVEVAVIGSIIKQAEPEGGRGQTLKSNQTHLYLSTIKQLLGVSEALSDSRLRGIPGPSLWTSW